MKKLFIVVLAAAAMVACTNDEVVSVKGGDAIAFDNAFIDNATRTADDPSTTTGSISAFDVWAFMDEPAGIVFEDEDVTKSGNEWAYANIQYWLPGHTYYFAALAPMNSANWDLDTTGANTDGIGEVTFRNIDGSEDLIYAAASVATSDKLTEQPAPVKFHFNHLLSKVKFTFKNGFTNDNAKLVIEKIEMVVPKAGTIDLAQADWWSTNEWELGAEDVTLKFGNVDKMASGAQDECTYERLTIPADDTEEYAITFDAKLFMGDGGDDDVLAIHSTNLKATVTGVALEIGKAYNFVATIDGSNITQNENGENTELYPIVFDVEEVKNWVPADNNVVVTETQKTPIVVADNTTYDGKGNTITAAPDRAQNENGIFVPEGTVTIKNVTIDGNNEKTESGQVMRGIYIQKGGTYTVDNVKILNCGYSINATTSETVVLNVTNSLLQSWISWSASTTATFDNVEFTPGQYAIMRPQGNATFTDCEFADGFKFSLDLFKGTALTFENCTYNGVALTAIEDSMIDTTYYDVNDVTLNRNKVIFQ